MKKLTDENSREQFEAWVRNHYCYPAQFSRHDKSGDYENLTVRASWRAWQASREALPILEQQERGDAPERKESLKHVGYLFVNSGGGVVYSPSGFGMLGFTCAGKIYGDVSFQQERNEGDWVEWDGGKQPIADGREVAIKFRDGTVMTETLSDCWVWSHGGDEEDIIAYRIIPEQPTNQNGEQ